MAAVVATVSVTRTSVWGDRKCVDATISFDTGDYAAGGVALTPANFGLSTKIDFILTEPGYEVSATPTYNLYRWNSTTAKLEVIQSAAAGAPFTEKGVEAFGAGANVRVLVIGY